MVAVSHLAQTASIKIRSKVKLPFVTLLTFRIIVFIVCAMKKQKPIVNVRLELPKSLHCEIKSKSAKAGIPLALWIHRLLANPNNKPI